MIHATLGVTRGAEALSLILQATPQSSEFRAHLSTPETTIQGSLESFLLRPTSSPPAPETVDADPQSTGTTEMLQPQSSEGVKAVQTGPASHPASQFFSQSALQPSSQLSLQSSLRPGEVVPKAFMDDLANALVDVMGPIGTIILEDAQADLNLEGDVPKREVQTLIAEIIQQLKTPVRQQPFQKKVDALLRRYSLN